MFLVCLVFVLRTPDFTPSGVRVASNLGITVVLMSVTTLETDNTSTQRMHLESLTECVGVGWIFKMRRVATGFCHSACPGDFPELNACHKEHLWMEVRLWMERRKTHRPIGKWQLVR